MTEWLSSRYPPRSSGMNGRDTPQVRPCRLIFGIHASDGPVHSYQIPTAHYGSAIASQKHIYAGQGNLPQFMNSSIEGRDRGKVSRKNQAALSGANKSGAFCEDCPSPDFLRSKKWSSSAAATFVCGAAAFSRGLPPVVPASAAEKKFQDYPVLKTVNSSAVTYPPCDPETRTRKPRERCGQSEH